MMFGMLSFQNFVFWYKSSYGGVVLSLCVCILLLASMSTAAATFRRLSRCGIGLTKRGLTRPFHASTFSEQFPRHIRVVLMWHARFSSVLSEDLFCALSNQMRSPAVVRNESGEFPSVEILLFQHLEKKIRTCCFASASAPLLACRFQCECSSELGHV